MSLVQDLADHIRVARDDLPVAQVTAAAERLRSAGDLLAWVMQSTSDPARIPQLSGAVERLENAVALMRGAQDALDAYTAALGISTDGAREEWTAALVPSVPAQNSRSDVAQLTDWWAARVSEIAGGGPDTVSRSTRAEAAATSAELLRRCTAAALDENPVRLRRELAAAGPAVGLGVAAIAPPLLRHLAGELCGHPARLEDLARVRRAALPKIAALLPKLPAAAAEEALARVCHVQPQRRSDSTPIHPVDAAAAATVLVAGLLAATGRSAADLAKVIEAERGAAQSAATHRAALRVTDPTRRRSAIDALGEPRAVDRSGV
ncbi:hypothetical protein F4553_005492 [Allocatelliglobosispora scoriae]|uniref:Uncharacterized protein n=1 Tax=Allocatelliglobosispora scoriae TaxID=643052 RepID=A0A841BX36_9ACTN|nr:hypothetical protein [Allocatelliglobosispora scoriae]MBB5872058.1 hypothetical protein [Allocatelliglobosispora scoriae]